MACFGKYIFFVNQLHRGFTACSCTYPNLTKRTQLFCGPSSSSKPPPLLFTYSFKSTVLVSDKLKRKINKTMLKMLAKKIKPSKKNKDFFASAVDIKPTTLPSHLVLEKKTIAPNKRILAREHMISSVLLRELQETVNSGQIHEDLDTIYVEFTKVILLNRGNAAVTWEPHNPEEDERIQGLLTRHASSIRHVIIQSKVIGKVPSFIFVIDPKASEEKTVDRILASENFDTGPLEDVENLMISDDKISNKVRKIESISSDPTFNLFRVDSIELRRKIYEKKSKIS